MQAVLLHIRMKHVYVSIQISMSALITMVVVFTNVQTILEPTIVIVIEDMNCFLIGMVAEVKTVYIICSYCCKCKNIEIMPVQHHNMHHYLMPLSNHLKPKSDAYIFFYEYVYKLPVAVYSNVKSSIVGTPQLIAHFPATHNQL